MANPSANAFDLMEEHTRAHFTPYHTLFDDGDVVEFADGSVYCFDDNNYTGGAYPNMEAFMEEVSSTDGVYADNSEELEEMRNEPFLYIEGKVENNPFPDRIELSLLLTGITRHGISYPHFGTSERGSENADECPLVYTAELAKLLGNRVSIKCETAHYNAEGTSARGNPYHYTADYLGSAKVVLHHSNKERTASLPMSSFEKLDGRNPRQNSN